MEETTKIEKTRSEINEERKIENPKIIKTINVISSKIDKQVFFFMLYIKQMMRKHIEIIYKTLKKINSHEKYK